MRIFVTSVFITLAGLTLCVTSGCGVTAQQSSNNSVGEDVVPTVTFCELMKDPDKFHDRIVRVKANFQRAFEQSYLSDSGECRKQDSLSKTWVIFHKSLVMAGDSEEAKKNNQVSGFGRWSLTAVGRFRWAKGPTRFGHLGCCRYEFAVMKIENSEKL